jgi:hypothetical protein
MEQVWDEWHPVFVSMLSMQNLALAGHLAELEEEQMLTA